MRQTKVENRQLIFDFCLLPTAGMFGIFLLLSDLQLSGLLKALRNKQVGHFGEDFTQQTPHVDFAVAIGF